MAKCNISINFNGSSEVLIGQAEQAITGVGGTFSGDQLSGNFTISSPIGKVSGNYSVEDQTFSIAITDKPFLLSCNRIEDELRKYIAS